MMRLIPLVPIGAPADVPVAREAPVRSSAPTGFTPALVATCRFVLRLLLAWSAWLQRETVLVFAITTVGIVAHGLNMLNYPGHSTFDDEGIYVAQAWSVIRLGELSPYTYFYDHAAAGWLLMAAWMWLTGGPHAFGSGLDGGRMLMFVLHTASIPLLYHLARKLGGGVVAASLAATLFSISPLAVFYQRLVLLDNIMVFWLLLSLELLLNGWGRLSRVVLSGACYGLALLTKETAVFFVPAFLFIAWQDRWRHQDRFAVIGWLVPLGIVVSLYPLHAQFKGELLPAGMEIDLFFFKIGNLFEHVSLIDSLRWQMQRGGGGMFNLDNSFWRLVRVDWMARDALLFAGGAAAILINAVRGVKDRRAFAVALLGVMPMYYLGRGGLVFSFYVIAAVPFLALNLALALAPVLNLVPRRGTSMVAALTSVALVAGYALNGTAAPLYTQRPADASRDAVAWIKRNLPPASMLIINDNPWTDFHEPTADGPVFPNAHSHWKVALDPAVKDKIFQGTWETVDYLLLKPGLRKDFLDTNNTVVLEALEHASLVRRWKSDGDHFELWKVNKAGDTETALVIASQLHLSRKERDGAIAGADLTVMASSQAAALLRAVWSDDRASFERVWSWTATHLQRPDGLLAWREVDGTVDSRSSADANAEAALALFFASRRWNEPAFHDAGLALAHAIWNREVVAINGIPYPTSGDWAVGERTIALSPGDFAPHAYAVFAEADPDHDWDTLIASGFHVLERASVLTTDALLPPEWIGIDRETGQVQQLDVDGSNRFGSGAARAFFKTRLYIEWNRSGTHRPVAEYFLTRAAPLWRDAKERSIIGSSYGVDGTPISDRPSAVMMAGALASLKDSDPKLAHQLYAFGVLGEVSRTGDIAYWGDPSDLATQEWAWLTAALSTGLLDNW